MLSILNLGVGFLSCKTYVSTGHLERRYLHMLPDVE